MQENKFNVNIPAKKYFDELKRMKKQYGLEEDLYPWIYMLLQMTECKKNISIRDVHNCKRKITFPHFFGLAGAPDFAIVNKEYNFNESEDELFKVMTNTYGCIEIKGLNESLLNVKDLLIELKEGDLEKKINVHRYQTIGHLLWYGKVLYTNGLEWQLLKFEKTPEICNDLKCILEKRNTENLNWLRIQEAKDFLKSDKLSVCDIQSETIADFTDAFKDYDGETITQDINNKWKNLLDKLSEINWRE